MPPERCLIEMEEYMRPDKYKRLARFGEKVSMLRKSMHLSQEKFSEKTGLNLKQISRIESGRHEAGFLVIQDIAKACSVSTDSLMPEDE